MQSQVIAKRGRCSLTANRGLGTINIECSPESTSLEQMHDLLEIIDYLHTQLDLKHSDIADRQQQLQELKKRRQYLLQVESFLEPQYNLQLLDNNIDLHHIRIDEEEANIFVIQRYVDVVKQKIRGLKV